MRDRIVSNLTTRFDAFDALVAQLDDEALHAKLDIEKHKSLAEHLWCVVGSRESYAKAITEGSWSGFACSVSSFSKADFTTKLIQSAELFDVSDQVNSFLTAGASPCRVKRSTPPKVTRTLDRIKFSVYG